MICKPYPEKVKIFEACLEAVLFEGWNESAIEKAAIKAGFDPRLGKHYFPEGALSILTFLSNKADDFLKEEASKLNLKAMRIHERIGSLTRIRLMAYWPYREALQAYGAHLIFPSNFLDATQLSFQTVDLIWQLAGDSSTDFNYYSKRALLWLVYSSTALFWLQDQSEDFMESWAFLSRRLQNTLAFAQLKSNMKGHFSDVLPMPSYFLKAFTRK